MSVETKALGSLAEARLAPGGVVILEGDWGGQVYLVAPAACVACDEAALERLLRELDAVAWPGNDPGSASIRYERRSPGDTVPGGMGGGEVREDVWIHPELLPYADRIRAALAG